MEITKKIFNIVPFLVAILFILCGIFPLIADRYTWILAGIYVATHEILRREKDVA